jgi:OOP family OmpA-OmpF porin
MLRKMMLAALAGAMLPGAVAQNVTNIQAKPGNSAYAEDVRGVIVRSPYGLCWRTGYWTPSDAVAGCDGELAPPVAKAIAPPVSPPVITAPTPAPVVEPAIPLPARCDFAITLRNEETFAFNTAQLTAAAIRRLDSEFLPRLAACHTLDGVRVTGHADWMGTHQYNQQLSEKRADAVAAFLRNKGIDIPLETVGTGENEPIQTCNDQLKRQEMIKCLAPNRRVTIDVRGLTK